jgi:SAM-dependent methyltransferase
MRADLVRVLRCVACGGEVAARLSLETPVVDALVCATCGRTVPVVGGIPRFVDVIADGMSRRTQASFGYEWTHFADWRPSGETNFQDYFEGADLGSLRRGLVLDAGCGMGRHARQIAPLVERVIAVDFSLAIDQAARNVSDLPNVDCIQADLMALPLADSAFDYVYSIGVLHHVADTEAALRVLVRKVRPGGRLRVYLYWKRHGWTGRALALVTAARRLTTSMPFGLLRTACWLLSLVLYVVVILPYRLLSALGVHAHQDWPLFVYTKYPFKVLDNDQFDRFSAPIEKRYDAEDVRHLMEAVGLREVDVRPQFGWIAEGTRPA